jgi:hypothetical protein
MNWHAIGPIAEMLGAIGVIASLVYVGIQVRQNTRTTHAASINAHITSANFVRQQIVANAEVADIYAKGMANPDDLTELEKVRFRVLFASILWTSWNAFAQTQLTGLDGSTFEAQKPFIRRLFTMPGGRWFWQEYADEFESEFQVAIEEIIEEA